MNSMVKLTLAWLAVAGLSGAAFAQEKKEEEPPKRDQKAIDYEKAVKDLKKVDGPFPLYLRKKDILVELSEANLGKQFLVQCTLSTGFSQNAQAGDPIPYSFDKNFSAIRAFTWEKVDDERVALVRPNIATRWDPSDPLALAASRSYPKSTFADYRVEQFNPETKSYLVNVTNMFNGEVNDLPMLMMLFTGGQYSLDRDLSGVQNAFSAGDKTIVRMGLHFTSPRNIMSLLGGMGGGEDNPLAALFGGSIQAEDARSLPISVNYAFWYRKDNGFVPRLADARVGYFNAEFYDVSRFNRRDLDRTTRYINRWHLVKKDPTAQVSEPVKPIVWTLDHSIPEKYRPAVREGILRWNAAFEQIGFKNALQVVDAPKDDPNYDHADGLRNVVRFTMTPNAGYAVAHAYTDPFTGEILNASVTIDANFVAFLNREFQVVVYPTTTQLQTKMDVARLAFLNTKPEVPRPSELLTGDYLHRDPRLAAAEKLGWKQSCCDYQHAKMTDLQHGFHAAQAMGMSVNTDAYIADALADVVCHEVGHNLGLRHNFVASTTLSFAELGDPQKVRENGVASSVMDYTPMNIQGIFKRNADLFMNDGVGPYDKFAIEYGYVPTGAKDPEAERFALGQIARKGGRNGLRYMTDEDADAFDPFVVRFDAAKNPIEFFQRDADLTKILTNWVVKNRPANGESYNERNASLLRAFQRSMTTAMSLSRFVGGVEGNRNFKGDENEKPTLRPVSPDQQRQAMKSALAIALAPTTYPVDASLFNNMGVYSPEVGAEASPAPLFRVFVNMQALVLAELMSAAKAVEILENEFKVGPNGKPYTLEENYGLILGTVFSANFDGKPVPATRRELQALCVDGLVAQAGAAPGGIPNNIRRVASQALVRLRPRFEASASRSGLDAATREHYRELALRIKRFENRMVTGSY